MTEWELECLPARRAVSPTTPQHAVHLLTWPSEVLETSIQRYLLSQFLFTAEVVKQAVPPLVTGKLLTVGNVRTQLLPATPLKAARLKPLIEVLMHGLHNGSYLVVCSPGREKSRSSLRKEREVYALS